MNAAWKNLTSVSGRKFDRYKSLVLVYFCLHCYSHNRVKG